MISSLLIPDSKSELNFNSLFLLILALVLSKKNGEANG